ncbi:MAG: dihydrofolate reductase [Alphaproteobacteria bacterium]|nr:dihydrofolate reductase [Alphaproteobacteria bacterium]
MSAARIALVVAMAENRVIGKDGSLPWRIPEDMTWFREITMGKPCIMGRKTWESLPKKPLPGRINIVVTRNPDYKAPGATVASSFDEAIAVAMHQKPDEIAVLGGAQIYAEAMKRADRIYVTRVHKTFDGDVHFPAIDEREWQATQRVAARTSRSGLTFDIVELDRAR